MIEAAAKARARTAVRVCLETLEELGCSGEAALVLVKEELNHE